VPLGESAFVLESFSGRFRVELLRLFFRDPDAFDQELLFNGFPGPVFVDNFFSQVFPKYENFGFFNNVGKYLISFYFKMGRDGIEPPTRGFSGLG
jgi:hypothetical protein